MDSEKNSSVNSTMTHVSTHRWYNEYHGHRVEDLNRVHQVLREKSESIVFLAGDSSLDNKYWLLTSNTAIYGQDACNGYENILRPPKMEEDINYWFNKEIVNRSISSLACLNTSVEASTLGERVDYFSRGLWPQDEFIRDNLTTNDTIVVSVGKLSDVYKIHFHLSTEVICIF